MKNGSIAVTGSSRGIGAGIARELATRGFTVGCLSRGGLLPEGSDTLGRESRDRLIPIACDVTDEAALSAAFRNLAERTGGIRGLINNAGVHADHRAHAMATAEFEAVMRTNSTAVFVACREVYPHMVERGRGIIVNIGSFFEKLAPKGSAAYCASKAAVGALTRCLAAEWAMKGISVLAIAPGYVETDVNREFLNDPVRGAHVRSRSFLRRPGEAGEIARLVAALFVEDIPFLTGETIFVDGGHGISL